MGSNKSFTASTAITPCIGVVLSAVNGDLVWISELRALDNAQSLHRSGAGIVRAVLARSARGADIWCFAVDIEAQAESVY
jgi:hypothetical protein